MAQPHQRLVLFDIDGTILHGGRLWRECFEGAMRAEYETVEFPRISFSGKTDRQICRELIEGAGLSIEEAAVDRVIGDYLSRVRACILVRAHEVRLLPGVRELVEELRNHPAVSLGLLTGNVREGATLKLRSVGMDHYFGFGAFGDDHWNRYELPAIAVKRAHLERGLEFRGKQIVIIGDTIHDVNCGRTLGVRAIAVGTGQAEQREHILGASPDFFFEDLSDTAAVISAVLG